MSITGFCRRSWASGSGATLGVVLLLVFGAGLALAPGAEAQTQCGALITLGPDKGQNPPGDILTPGGPNNVVHITVSILQTCTTGGVAQAANVTGTTRVDVACATANNLTDPSGTGCAALEQLNTLHVTGCTPAAAGISCAPAVDGGGNATIAAITYSLACPGGGNTCFPLAFATPTLLATITATTVPGQQVFSPTSGEFAVTASTGGSNVFTAAASASGQGSAPEFYPAPTPTFTLSKSCTATFNSQTQQVNVSFTATLTNQDTFEAINYNCSDVPAATLTNNPGQAAANGTAVVTGTYSQAALTASDTITCSAAGATTGFSAGTQTAQTTCSATTNPSISVAKTCQNTSGQTMAISAQVCNNGNEALNSVQCNDSPPITLSGVPATLAPGVCATVTGTYTASVSPSTDVLTCSGVGATSGTTVQNSGSATCTFQTAQCPTSFTGFAGVSLGAAANFTVLVLDSPVCSSDVVLSAPATTIEGDVGICAGVTGDLLKLKIDGDLLIQDPAPDPGLNIHPDVKVTGVITYGADSTLSDACGVSPSPPGDPGDCRDASTAAAALCGAGPFPNVTGSTTFLPGVTCINNINTTKATFTFNGSPADRYIINVVGPGAAGVHILNNLKTVLSEPDPSTCGTAAQTGVCPFQILWNFTAPGTTVSFYKPDATLAGSVLVPNGSFIQDHGSLAGTVCAGCTAKFHSGAFVSCPNP